MFRVLKILVLLLLLAVPASAKHYTGSAWVDDTCKYYTGSAWVDCTKNRYDGAAWGEIEATTVCPTCSNGLLQAFILDDGSANNTDRVGSNDLTISGATWGSNNNGLIFDGVNDYAAFTPTLTEWQFDGGVTIAILTTVANVSNACILHQYYAADSEKQIKVSSNQYDTFNRITTSMGRNYSNAEVYIYASSGDSGKQWLFTSFDPSAGTAEGEASYYKNLVLDNTDTTVDTYADNYSMDTGFLGAEQGNTNFGAETIYRVMIWNRVLTAAERSAVVNDGWTP